MTLRTPRRRISPRTKRRYRAIREFFRRALGSSSQPDIKLSSSIAVNVTDLKRKINGLEQQLDEVNKHCQDIACLDCSRKDSVSTVPSVEKHEINTIKEQTEGSSERKLDGIETKFLYKSSECNYRKSEESEYIPKIRDDEIDFDQTEGMIDEYGEHNYKVKNKKSKQHKITDYASKLHKYRPRSVYDNFVSAYSTSSFHSLANSRVNKSHAGYSGHPNDIKYHKQEYIEEPPTYPHKVKKHKEHKEHKEHNEHWEHKKRHNIDHRGMNEQKSIKIRKHRQNRELDQDFIADIIRRQYKPVKMFGRKESDLSQFSAPVCRDQEFKIRDDLQEGNELCSCCFDDRNHHKPRLSDLSEMRSICDTRLYSSKKHTRGKHRRMHVEIFNNSDLYDLIPVKEKSSPKTRRKFTEDNWIPYEYYREVPPSPRTLRPRLNLKAQYNKEFEDYMTNVKHRKGSPHKKRHQREPVEAYESDVTSEPIPNKVIIEPKHKTLKDMKCQVEQQEPCQQEIATVSSLQDPPYLNEHTNLTLDSTFNKTQETEINVDKTDKALCEIKNILQSFLHEIKKEANGSQCDKSEISSKTGDIGTNIINENSAKLNSNIMPNSKHSFNNYSSGQCNAPPFIAPFANPCCYPIMPICPMNCPMTMQNGFLMPSQSYTCSNCVNAAKEPVHNEHCCKNVTTTGTCHTETCHTEACNTDTCHTEAGHTETEDLIKEIYKFVAQGPVRKRDYEACEPKKDDAKMLTSRSVGESSKLSKHDAQVGTAPLKCYSKSCEAIGSRIIQNNGPYSSTTNASYSDTILEKMSLEVTQTTSETEETETTIDKGKRNKFSKVMRSIGFFKKKKKDVIEELSESESTVDVDVKAKSPYRQDITNYMMHGQEYFHPPPPMSPNYQRPNEYQPNYHPSYNPAMPEYPPRHTIQDIFTPRTHHQMMHERTPSPPVHPKQQPTAPPYNPYDNHFNRMPPQPPLCLKEIEVKSIGTQSERKMSIFQKFQKKIQLPPEDDYDQKNCSIQTQTIQNKNQPKQKPAPVSKPLFNWNKLQAKAMGDQIRLNDPVQFSMKAQQELAAGDLKIRKAMLKKLFYKRNPFSPRNLIVRTLLGKDKSSFGEPPAVFRPRMFF